VEPKRQDRIEDLRQTRKTEKLDALLREIGDDARRRAESYPEDTRVPEGGE
jgi:hypothetical protein